MSVSFLSLSRPVLILFNAYQKPPLPDDKISCFTSSLCGMPMSLGGSLSFELLIHSIHWIVSSDEISSSPTSLGLPSSGMSNYGTSLGWIKSFAGLPNCEYSASVGTIIAILSFNGHLFTWDDLLVEILPLSSCTTILLLPWISFTL